MRLARLRWSEVNFDTSTVTIPTSRTKSGRQLQLTLPTPAMDLLRERREKQIANLVWSDRGFVFAVVL